MLIALMGLLTVLCFAQENPLGTYMKDPGVQNFKAAVDHIAAQDAADPTALRNKLTLAFIANHQVSQILSMAEAKLSELSAGERFTLANLYLGMEQYDKAIAIYDVINSESPKWSCPWRHKGEALYKQKKFKAAVKALQEAVNTNKTHYDAYVWLAFAQYETKQYKAALKSLETAMALDAEEEGSHHDEEIPDEKIRELHQKLLKRVK